MGNIRAQKLLCLAWFSPTGSQHLGQGYDAPVMLVFVNPIRPRGQTPRIDYNRVCALGPRPPLERPSAAGPADGYSPMRARKYYLAQIRPASAAPEDAFFTIAGVAPRELRVGCWRQRGSAATCHGYLSSKRIGDRDCVVRDLQILFFVDPSSAAAIGRTA